MLNYLWAGMIIIGIVYGAFCGTLPAITAAVIDSAKEAVALCITMLGVMSFWSGFMEMASQAGLVESLAGKMRPVMRFLFPQVSENSRAYQFITTNMVANVLGLGWAATPAGLKAMEELSIPGSESASNEMCTFLVINISSLQLIPMNMIAYRSQYGSVNPAAIIAPGIVATAVSTLTAVIFCKWMSRRLPKKEQNDVQHINHAIYNKK